MARMLTPISASGTATEVSKPVIPNSKGPSSLRARQPRSQVIPTGTRSARSRLTVACAASTPSSARDWTTPCWVPSSRSGISLRMRSRLVVLSTGARVAPKVLRLLLEVLEPQILGVPERQVHVLHRQPGRTLEQVVHRREEQELPCPHVHRRREPGPVGVGHVSDVRRLRPRLDEPKALVVLCVPAQHVPGAGERL